MIDWIWIVLAALFAIFCFSLIEDWYSIGPIDHDEPEDP